MDVPGRTTEGATVYRRDNFPLFPMSATMVKSGRTIDTPQVILSDISRQQDRQYQ